MKNKCLRGDNSNIYRVGLWFLSSALPLVAIYLFTKFHLNANSSFKVICRTGNRTNGQNGDYMLPPLGRIKMYKQFENGEDNFCYYF